MSLSNTPAALTANRTPGISARLVAAVREIGDTAAQIADAMPLRFSMLVLFILQPLVVLLFQPSYETNDDVFITMIASGKGICPAPDEHLIFTNILVGQVLKPLYTAIPGIPWYGCYLLLAHFAAQVAILYCALVVGRTAGGSGTSAFSRLSLERQTSLSTGYVWPRFGLYLLYFALVELTFLNRMQYTTTAFVTSQAGIFLMLLAWHRRARQSDAVVFWPLVTAVILIVGGGIIRLDSLVMSLLVAVPTALLFLRDFSRRALVPCSVAMISALALVGLAVAYDHWAYEHDPTWRGFRSYNQLRGTFHDGGWTSYTPETEHVFTQVGWSENDHAMIARWFSDDQTLFNKSNLTTIVDAYPWRLARDKTELAWATIREIVHNRSFVAVLLALPYALIVVRGGQNARRAVLGSAVAAVALIVLVTWVKKVPPERVFYPLLSFPLAATLLSFAWRSENKTPVTARHTQERYFWSWSAWRSKPMRTRVILTLLIVAVVMSVYRQTRRSTHVRRDRVALQKFLNDLQPAGQKLYITWESALPYELVSPLDNLGTWSQASFLSLSWNQRTPWNEAIKRRFGITNLACAMYERDDMELVATPEHLALFTIFAKEHFDAEVEFIPSFEAGKKFVAGRFQRQMTYRETATNAAEASRR